jgi:protein phosphatase
MLSDTSIAQILSANAALDQSGQALIDAANDAGGKDNISVILARAQGGAVAAGRSWWPFRR